MWEEYGFPIFFAKTINISGKITFFCDHNEKISFLALYRKVLKDITQNYCSSFLRIPVYVRRERLSKFFENFFKIVINRLPNEQKKNKVYIWTYNFYAKIYEKGYNDHSQELMIEFSSRHLRFKLQIPLFSHKNCWSWT